jgi:hypothetical protein
MPSFVTATFFSEVPAKRHTSSIRAKSFMLIGRLAELSGFYRQPMVRSTTLVLGKRFIPKTDSSKVLAIRIYDINISPITLPPPYRLYYVLFLLHITPIGPDTSHTTSHTSILWLIQHFIQSRTPTTQIHIRKRRHCTSHLVFFTTVHSSFAYLAHERLWIASANGDDGLRSWTGVYI